MKVKVTMDNLEHTMQTAAAEIERLLTDDKTVSITVDEWKESRSLNQNALYFKWLGEISKQIHQKVNQKHDTDTLHEYFKQRFCPRKAITLGKKEITIVSTKRLNKGEMTQYMYEIEAWAINVGFKLTVPVDSQYQKLACTNY